MKQILFILLLAPLALFGQQKGELIRDTLFFTTELNECDSLVWFVNQYVEFRGGRKVTDSAPVGFNENQPCEGIKARDTAQLVAFYANPLIDYTRQQANKAKDFIFQTQTLKSFDAVNRALTRKGLPSIYGTIERAFADSLVGNYILKRPGLADANVTIQKLPIGTVRIRVNAQTNFPLVVYGDGFVFAKNLAGTNKDVQLFQIEPGRWISLDRDYQLVKSARQVVQGVQK
jgi:hypothetical protein